MVVGVRDQLLSSFLLEATFTTRDSPIFLAVCMAFLAMDAYFPKPEMRVSRANLLA